MNTGPSVLFRVLLWPLAGFSVFFCGHLPCFSVFFCGSKPEDAANHRNETSGKTVLTDDESVAIDVPAIRRDRADLFHLKTKSVFVCVFLWPVVCVVLWPRAVLVCVFCGETDGVRLWPAEHGVFSRLEPR